MTKTKITYTTLDNGDLQATSNQYTITIRNTGDRLQKYKAKIEWHGYLEGTPTKYLDGNYSTIIGMKEQVQSHTDQTLFLANCLQNGELCQNTMNQTFRKGYPNDTTIEEAMELYNIPAFMLTRSQEAFTARTGG